MKKNIRFNILSCIAYAGLTFSLSACGGSAKEKLGLTRKTPDEFAVVSRAPLELPPDYALRPPRPGAPRPQEENIVRKSESVVFGSRVTTTQAAPESGEVALLQRAGAKQADPAIRVLVDAEYEAISDDDKPVAEKLLGIKLGGGNDEDETLDPTKERQRLRTSSPPSDDY